MKLINKRGKHREAKPTESMHRASAAVSPPLIWGKAAENLEQGDSEKV